MPEDASASAGTTPAEQTGTIGVIQATGGILVVALGLVFVFILGLVAMGTVQDDEKSTIVSAAFTVIGTVVGTYFGVRAGAAGKERAEAARDFESLKVQELAAHVDPAVAQAAFDKAERRVVDVRKASSTTIPTM
ncbi:MAG TPA: hypothetical protein VGF25_17905 [Thermoleophilaceae bacterium]|jgi:hypothetical protein